MTNEVDPAIRRELYEEQLAELKDKERALKRENMRISDEIKQGRPQIYWLVEKLKELNAQVAA